MSTYQPPGGTPSEPTPLQQPQDPWGGLQDAGIAAAPTDPIPQPAPGQFAQGVAAPSVWSQETVSHSGYGYLPQPGRSRAGTFIGVILAVIVLGGGLGYGAYWLVTHRSSNNPPQTQSTSTPPNTSPSTSNPNPTPSVVPADVKVNDCLFNAGTEQKPIMQAVPCTKPDSYKVVKIASGESIPEGPDGKFDRDHTSAIVCAGTGSTAWYAWDSSDNSRDYFFCLTEN